MTRNSPTLLNDSGKHLSVRDFIDILDAAHQKKGKITFKAKGSSMAPFIKDGDMLTIRPMERQRLIGRIVLYLDPCDEIIMVHRVIDKIGRDFIIKGDNQKESDGQKPFNTFKGIVDAIQRNGDEITFGLGSERRLIAMLSRMKLLLPALKSLRFIKKCFKGIPS